MNSTENWWRAEIEKLLFRPGFDEESLSRFRANTEHLWREVFKTEIDVQREIIARRLLAETKVTASLPPITKAY